MVGYGSMYKGFMCVFSFSIEGFRLKGFQTWCKAYSLQLFPSNQMLISRGLIQFFTSLRIFIQTDAAEELARATSTLCDLKSLTESRYYHMDRVSCHFAPTQPGQDWTRSCWGGGMHFPTACEAVSEAFKVFS